MTLSPGNASNLRTLLKVGGTALAMTGGLTADDVASLVNVAEMFFGAAFTLWGTIWSVWSKRATSTEAKQVAVTVVEDKLPVSQAAGVVARIDAPAKEPG